MPSPRGAAAQNMGLLLMIAGSAVDSTSGLFTRLIHADGFTLASGRGFFAFIITLAVLFWRDGRKAPATVWGIGLTGLCIVLLNATGMIVNILSLSYTSVANFFMIFAAAPFAAALAARLVLGEKLDVPTLLAAAAGFAGIAIMMASGATGGGLIGDLLAVLCLATYSGIILLVRKTPTFDVVPMACVTVLTSGLLALPFADFSTVTSHEWPLFALFGMVQLAIGNFLIFMAMTRIPAAQSGLLGILNAAFAPLWVFFFLGEWPTRAALIGGGIILASAAAHLAWTMWQAPRAAAHRDMSVRA